LLFLLFVLSQQETGPNTAQLNTAESYPNTLDGLHRLLDDLLLAAKNDDQAKLRSQITEMEIPNYENWFTRTFGQEKGERFGGMYGKSLRASELQFEMLCTELAKQKGEISIEKVDTTRRYGALSGPLDEYKANWKKTDDSVGPLVSAKLINRVQPVYPEAARKLKIQGTVSVKVIVRKDETVTVQNVGAGHPLLAPAAAMAVQQWRYQPTTVNGEPVDVQAKVYVTFTLSNQPNQQK
jgi:protein TonB